MKKDVQKRKDVITEEFRTQKQQLDASHFSPDGKNF